MFWDAKMWILLTVSLYEHQNRRFSTERDAVASVEDTRLHFLWFETQLEANPTSIISEASITWSASVIQLPPECWTDQRPTKDSCLNWSAGVQAPLPALKPHCSQGKCSCARTGCARCSPNTTCDSVGLRAKPTVLEIWAVTYRSL